MPQVHTVRDGECIASIAFAHGFHPDTIWNDPANATLREQRGHGYSLLAGDEVTIPDLRGRGEPAKTGARHTYRRLGVPEKLRIQLKDSGEPRAFVGYVLEIDAGRIEGQTDADGRLEAWVSPAASRARLTVADEEPFDLSLGFLKPLASEEGVRSRLRNLSFLARTADDAESLAMALSAFQGQHGLEATGRVDQATRDKLLQEHKS